MAKQEECSKCKRAKQGSFAGEIKCSFYGRKPQFDGNACPNYWDENVEKRCPDCGQAVDPTASTCPNCGCPLEQSVDNTVNRNNNIDFPAAKLLTPKAESILCKYGEVIKILGLIAMIIIFAYAIVAFVKIVEKNFEVALLSALTTIAWGVLVYLFAIVIKAFINVFVNISVTLQDINRKTKDND